MPEARRATQRFDAGVRVVRVVITGTRDGRADLWHWMRRFVARSGVPELWILGDARGVDDDAAELCRREGWIHSIYYAQWDRFGGRAGMLRNAAMVRAADHGDFCLGFPGAASRGTYHCIRIAQERGLRTHVMPRVRRLAPAPV